MKKRVCILAALLLVLLCAAALADVRIDEKNFPDAKFRNVVSAFDTNGDLLLSDEELEEVTSLSCSGLLMESMKGIEHFTSLEKLFCDGNQLTSLDLTRNDKLVTVICSENLLDSLNVSTLKSLTYFDCRSNALTRLDVSASTKLVKLICSANALSGLDLSRNTKLDCVFCANNRLTSLDLSKLSVLKALDCGGNRLTKLDVGKNAKLDYLLCDSNRLTKLNVSKNAALEYLHCMSNQIGTLDVSKCPLLARLVKKNGRRTQNGYDYFGTDYEGTPLLAFDCATTVKAGKVVSNPTMKPVRATVKGLVYKLNNKAKTASLIGVESKRVRTISIPASIKVYGKTYKVTSIAAGACRNLSSLTKVTIGKNVAKIGKNAFAGCKLVSAFIIKTAKLTAGSVGSGAFKTGNKKKTTVQCPKSVLKAYKKLLPKKGMPKNAKYK